MEEKRYLSPYNKFGYALGGGGQGFVYDIIAFFLLFYLTDVAGLNAGIIGTMMLVTRVTDGISDVIMGRLIDKTHTKLGKARPWKLWSYIGCAITAVMCFAIPESWGLTAKYIYFFIGYLMFNAVFYTMLTIAHNTLISLITKNAKERVQLNSLHYCAEMIIYFIIANTAFRFVAALGGGLVGWRNYAIILSIIGLVLNTISTFSTKELPEEELELTKQKSGEPEESIIKNLKFVVTNRYFIMIVGAITLQYITNGISSSSALYFFKYVMGNENLYGIYTSMGILPKLIGSVVVTGLFAKFGMYKMNVAGTIVAFLAYVGLAVSGFSGFFPGILVAYFMVGIGTTPFSCDRFALLSDATDYTYKSTGKYMAATFQAAGSVGLKIGTGLGSAIGGWLLTLGGYVANQAIQPESSTRMIRFMFLIGPILCYSLMIFFMMKLKSIKAKDDAALQMQ